jgi:aspartate 1-decarboxylase
MDEKEAAKHRPHVVFVDGRNRIREKRVESSRLRRAESN